MPTSFFSWVGFLLEKYWPLFLSGAGTTLLIALTGTIMGFMIGLLVAILRTVELSFTAGPVKRGVLMVAKWLMTAYIEIFRGTCLLYTSPSPRDGLLSRMP